MSSKGKRAMPSVRGCRGPSGNIYMMVTNKIAAGLELSPTNINNTFAAGHGSRCPGAMWRVCGAS